MHSGLMDDLELAQSAVTTLLADLPGDAWARASPCELWDVAGVVRHLVVGERAFATSLGGASYDLPVVVADVDAIAGADLAAAYAAGSARLREAIASADPAGAYPTGLGPMPVLAVHRLRTVEALVHGWDAATGAGGTLAVQEGVAERALLHSQELMERLPPGRTPFAPPQPVADGAPALDRLVALLGRRADWGADRGAD